MKHVRQIMMQKAKAIRLEIENKKLKELLENSVDVLEHYDNDVMVKEIIEEIKEETTELSFSDELYAETKGGG